MIHVQVKPRTCRWCGCDGENHGCGREGCVTQDEKDAFVRWIETGRYGWAKRLTDGCTTGLRTPWKGTTKADEDTLRACWDRLGSRCLKGPM